MEIKITNCTTIVGIQTRQNQNVTLCVDDDIFENISKQSYIKKLREGYHKFKHGSYFIPTLQSKVIVPKETMTPEQRLIFERKTKINRLLKFNVRCK